MILVTILVTQYLFTLFWELALQVKLLVPELSIPVAPIDRSS